MSSGHRLNVLSIPRGSRGDLQEERDPGQRKGNFRDARSHDVHTPHDDRTTVSKASAELPSLAKMQSDVSGRRRLCVLRLDKARTGRA